MTMIQRGLPTAAFREEHRPGSLVPSPASSGTSSGAGLRPAGRAPSPATPRLRGPARGRCTRARARSCRRAPS
jgi:hypothetical protein